MASVRRLRIRLARSPIGARKEHKATVRALGLRKVGQEVVREDKPSVRGMVQAVGYLLEVSEDTSEDQV